MNNSKSDDELLIHFFDTEIRNRMNDDESNEFFNGVWVGNKKAKELSDAHIRFCRRIIKGIKSGEFR